MPVGSFASLRLEAERIYHECKLALDERSNQPIELSTELCDMTLYCTDAADKAIIAVNNLLQTGNAIKQGSNWSKARLLFGKQDRQASKLFGPVTVTIAYLYTTFIYIHTLLSRPSHPFPFPCSLSLCVFILRCCCFTLGRIVNTTRTGHKRQSRILGIRQADNKQEEQDCL